MSEWEKGVVKDFDEWLKKEERMWNNRLNNSGIIINNRGVGFNNMNSTNWNRNRPRYGD